MKYLLLKSGTINVQTEKGEVAMPTSYADLIKIALDQPPKDGFTISEIRNRTKILNCLTENSVSLTLEDSDFSILKSCLADCRWRIRSSFIVELYDDILTNNQMPDHAKEK